MIRNKLIIIITTLVVVLVVFYLVGQFRESPQPKAAVLHDASSTYEVRWVSRNDGGTDTWYEGNSYEIDNLSRSYDVGIFDGNDNVTDEFAIAHAFLSAATAQDNTITLHSSNPGGYGEHGNFVLNTNSGFRLWVIAYRSASAEYVVQWVELFDNDQG